MSAAHKVSRIGIMTGGGDCPGLNAVIRVVTKAALRQLRVEVLGIEDGFLGLIRNRMRPLGWQDVSNILTAGGTILGTSNKADPSRFAVAQDPDGQADLRGRDQSRPGAHRRTGPRCCRVHRR